MVGVFKRIVLALGGTDEREQREEEPGNAHRPDGWWQWGWGETGGFELVCGTTDRTSW